MASKSGPVSGQKPGRYQAEKTGAESREIRSMLNNDIKNASPKQVYLLYGEEAYLRRSYKNRLKELIIGDDDMNYSYFEGAGTDRNEVAELAATMPFFGERRLIICENTGWFSLKDTAVQQRMLDELPETTYMIFCEESADRRYSLFSKVSSLGLAARLDYQTYDELCKWVARKFKSVGKETEIAAAKLLVERVGNDMSALSCETEKLIGFASERDAITKEDVEAVGVVRLNDRLFDMIDAAVEGNMKLTMDIYNELLALRVAPLKIMIIMGRHISDLITVKELIACGRSDREIASEAGVRDFLVKKYRKQDRLTGAEQLKEVLSLAVELDKAFKSGLISEQLACEMLIVKLCRG